MKENSRISYPDIKETAVYKMNSQQSAAQRESSEYECAYEYEGK
jgi:hypothetical protein